jgi:hypothetical protein
MQERLPKGIFWIVRKALTATAISLALAIGGQAHPELWCGNSRGTLLDHPCSDGDIREDPSLAATAEKHSSQWMDVFQRPIDSAR